MRPTKLLSLIAGALIVTGCSAGPGVATAPSTPSAQAAAPSVTQASASPSASPSPSPALETREPAASASGATGHDHVAAVLIEDFEFQPATIEARVGQVIEWTNKDGEPHTVRSDNGEFSSAIIVGAPFEWTATGTPGTEIPYICSIHPEMTGTVQIIEE